MNTVPMIEAVNTFEEIKAKIEAFVKAHENDGFGISPGYEFGHIVIDDCNLEDGYIQFCLDRADAWEKEKLDEAYQGWPNAYKEAARAIEKYKADLIAFLGWLLTIPEDARVLWDEEEPEWV